MISFFSFLLRIPVDRHRQRCHPSSPAAMPQRWWHNTAGHAGATARGGAKAGRGYKVCVREGGARFQPLAVKLRINSSAVLEESMPFHSSLPALIYCTDVTTSASSYEILITAPLQTDVGVFCCKQRRVLRVKPPISSQGHQWCPGGGNSCWLGKEGSVDGGSHGGGGLMTVI